MSQQSVILDIPSGLYERIREVAEENHVPLENILLESIALMFGELPSDDTLSFDILEMLADEHLWTIAHRRFALPQDVRLRELTTLGKRGVLSAEEQAEMEQLLNALDHYVLLRSKALLLLKERGHDVERQLKLGA